MPKRKATARWDGSFTEGAGTMRMGSGAYEGAYSAQSRFEEGEGTNPEELIAAAHAACFSMALSLALGQGGPRAREHRDRGHGADREGGRGLRHQPHHAAHRGPGAGHRGVRVPARPAEAAKEGCPVSQALAGVESIELEAKLLD